MVLTVDKNGAISLAKVSIIIQVYNCSDSLREVLESLRSQTYQNLKVLLSTTARQTGAEQSVMNTWKRAAVCDRKHYLMALKANPQDGAVRMLHKKIESTVAVFSNQRKWGLKAKSHNFFSHVHQSFM